jgi:hypothetical protein
MLKASSGRCGNSRVTRAFGNSPFPFFTLDAATTNIHRRFMGGNLAITRYYSRLLALQIKAIEEGLLSNEGQGGL